MEQNQLKELAEATRKILQTLNPLEAKIVRLSFGLEEKKPKTDAEIAKSLGIPAPFVVGDQSVSCSNTHLYIA